MEPPRSGRFASLYRGGSTVRLLGELPSTYDAQASHSGGGSLYHALKAVLPPRRRQDVQQRLNIFSKYKYPPKNNNPFLCSRKNGLSQNGKIPFSLFVIMPTFGKTVSSIRLNAHLFSVNPPPKYGIMPTTGTAKPLSSNNQKPPIRISVFQRSSIRAYFLPVKSKNAP